MMASVPTDSVRTRAVGLFRLLRDFAEHGSRAVRDWNNYDKVLWLADVPRSPGHYCRSWGQDPELDPITWLEVRGHAEPHCPLYPSSMEPWLATGFPFGDDDPPQLRQEIQRERPGDPGDRELLRLTDHPEIEGRWNKYLESAWLPWATKHQDWFKHHLVYSKLFEIFQAQQREGEHMKPSSHSGF